MNHIHEECGVFGIYNKAQADLALMMEQYDLAQKDLQGLTDELNAKQGELEAYAIQISKQEDDIKSQEKLIEDQKAYLAAANNEIVTLRSQMTTVAALRLSVLKQITDSLVDIIGDASKVSIGDNGNIVLSESLLQRQLGDGFSKLNDEGQMKAVDYVRDLTELERYTDRTKNEASDAAGA